MSRSGEDTAREGCPTGPLPPDGQAPSGEEQTDPDPQNRPPTEPDDDPFTGYEPL
ncbi:hypothetical protein [Streptomyces sp. NPDC020917]|uniref:hypothetical protein n=1 Tax=Streptomyces sp. NPDC020917 TaxID=3365102 RepID=UPI0037B763A0